MTITLRLVSSLTICSYLFGANLNAQSSWLPQTEGSSITVEGYRLDRPAGINNGTAFFLTGNIKSPSGLTLVFDFPFARSDERLRSDKIKSLAQSSQTAIGNPYFGVSYKGKSPYSMIYEAGIRIPLAPDDKEFAQNIGIKADFDRWEAFVSDQVSVRALVGRYWSQSKSPHTGWIKGGGTMLIPTDGDDFELLVDFQSGAWYMGDVVLYGFNLNGRALVTERSLSFSEQYEFLFGFGFMLNLGHFRPGLHGRYQITESDLFISRQNQNATFGLSLAISLGENEDE